MPHEIGPKNEQVTLEHISDRELTVNIVKDHQIARGGLGTVYSVHVNMGTRSLPFVLKEYNNGSLSRAKERAEHAFNIYRELKKDGFKVFKTFRLVKDQGSILMTNGLNEETVCTSSNNNGPTTVEDFGVKKLKFLSHPRELFEAVFAQTILANKKNIDLVGGDSFLFLVNKNNSSVDFVIGDLDLVKRYTNPLKGFEQTENIHAGWKALNDFLETNVENNEEFFLLLNELFYSKMKAFGLPYIHTNPPQPM